MYVYYWHEPVQEIPVKSRLVAHVRRVEVTDQLASGGDYDYADAYEVRLPEPDLVTPETWVRAGMDDSPAVVEWIADRLGLGDETSTSIDEIDGGRVVESNADVVHIEWSLPLMRVAVRQEAHQLSLLQAASVGPARVGRRGHRASAHGAASHHNQDFEPDRRVNQDSHPAA